MTVREIADALGVSLGTVSSNLPYEEEIHGSDSASDHAKAMRTYRAYERMQKERQVQMKQNERKAQNMSDDWKKDLDSRLSFTETDARRRRITYEMIRDAADRKGAVLGEKGQKQPMTGRMSGTDSGRKSTFRRMRRWSSGNSRVPCMTGTRLTWRRSTERSFHMNPRR